MLEDLNQAYARLAGLVANMDEDFFEEDNTKFDLVKNSSLYSLPADLIAFRQLRLAYSGTPSSPSNYRVSRTLEPSEVHLVSADQENIPTSTPIHDLTATYVRIKPTPTQAVTNGGSLFYIAMPSALVNTGDIPVLPTQFQELLSVYAGKEMAFKYEKWSKHDRLEKKWDVAIGEMMQVVADRDRDKPVRMKDPREVPAGSNIQRRELPYPY